MSKKLFFILTIGVIFSLPLPGRTAFDPNYIISNKDLTDHRSMSLRFVQQFLREKGGTLWNYYTSTATGAAKTAAEIIMDAATSHAISPKVLLVTLQKEQSLVENPSPRQYNYDWATGYARCDDCEADHPAIQKFKGFANQVENSAKRLRDYLEKPWEFRHQVGQPIMIDDQLVMPENQATAALYNYTPHLHGNQNFFNIWQTWFGKLYPDGTLLQAEGQAGVWLIENGKRRPIQTKSALLSRVDPARVIIVSKTDLEKYELGRAIQYPNYSLLRSPRGTVYLLVDDTRRGIVSMEVFRTLGFNPAEVIDVSWETLNEYAESRPITLADVYPTGALLQDKTTGGVYYVESGEKKPIKTRDILRLVYGDLRISPVSPEELAKYPTAAPVMIKDGELVKEKNGTTIYVISRGQKRPIASADVFEDFGYRATFVKEVSSETLALHSLGEPLNIISKDLDGASPNNVSVSKPTPTKPTVINPILYEPHGYVPDQTTPY